jgi:TPR repeat protein
MKRLIFSSALLLSAFSFSAHAATSFEVEEFNRASIDAMDALQSKNYDRAYENLNIASKLGNKISQFALALMYLQGLGVEQDVTQAYLWLNVAAEGKERKWRDVRDQIKSSLSEEQKAALQPMIDEYIAKYGEDAQEVSCYKRAEMGTNRKLMQCSKYRTPGK